MIRNALFYVAKFFQLLSLLTLLLGFVQKFPHLVSGHRFGMSCLLFILGWMIEKTL